MCGFAGYQHFSNNSSAVDLAFLENANKMLQHRGPDGEGIWQKGGQGLAHRRLAIIDLSPKAAQPMVHRSGNYAIAYNGEIYNYKELQRELIGLGHSFSSNSDTEVILCGFIQWGINVFAKLEGMFALAICNIAEHKTYLARDKFGEKPLFYTKTKAGYVFGSAIKPLLAWPDVTIEPNLEAIHHYLSLQYCPPPQTAFKGVFQLPPAHWALIDNSGEIYQSQYWYANGPTENRANARTEELSEEFLFHLEAGVKSRMLSDVPLGAFLSGGVDSSAVVAMMARHSSHKIKTFSIGFDENQYDERKYAKIVSEAIGTDHTEVILPANSTDKLEDLMWHLEEPFADPSIIPTYFVSKLARERVTVALSGDGGDELMMGYSRYEAIARMSAKVNPALASVAKTAHSLISPELAQIRPFGGIRRRLRSLFDNAATKYEPAIMAFLSDDKFDSYGPELAQFLNQPTSAILQKLFDQRDDIVSGAAWCDLHTYLPGDILKKVDNAAMAVSLEVRAPLLDTNFAGFALSLFRSQKQPNGLLKGFMKNALRDVLPHEILYRPKMGFGIPVDEWLKGPLKALMQDTLLDGRLFARNLFNQDYIIRIIKEHESGYRQHHTRIWTLIMLELWYRQWIDRPVDKIKP